MDTILLGLMVVSIAIVAACPICLFVFLNWLPEEEKEPAILKLLCLCLCSAAGFGVTGWLRCVYDRKPAWGLHGMLWRSMVALDVLLKGADADVAQRGYEC